MIIITFLSYSDPILIMTTLKSLYLPVHFHSSELAGLVTVNLVVLFWVNYVTNMTDFPAKHLQKNFSANLILNLMFS